MRTGLQRAVQLAQMFCKLYVVKKPAMVTYINAQVWLTPEQKTAAINALEAMMAACEALDILRIVYEP